MTSVSYTQLDFPEMAAIRYGHGLSPRFSPPRDADDLLTSLTGPDAAAARWPVIAVGEADALRLRHRVTRKNRDQDDAAYREALAALRDVQSRGMALRFARILDAPIGFRERLHWFWTDHFTTVARQLELVGLQLEHHDFAIRPRMSGKFSELLEAAVLHPMMLNYLDQTASRGPTSPAGLKQGGGVNENLAREVLELHTLGVDAAYAQEDVHQFALLLTGVGIGKEGMQFRPNQAEPGAEMVLGKRYGGRKPDIADVRAFLDDLARHPDTAHHLSRKLAVHFVDDNPDADLVAAMVRAYLDNDTELLPVYRAMVLHPAANGGVGVKVRQPFDWLATAMRGMGVTGDVVAALPRNGLRRLLGDPMSRMGQPWHKPVGPDGWPEEGGAWLTAPGLAERITWAMTVPVRLMPDLPEPRDLARRIVPGPRGEQLADLVFRAERRRDGLALVLASPDLNTR